MSRICLPGDAISGPFHDHAQNSNSLHTVVVSRRSKDSSIRDNPELLQFHKEPSDIDDVTERNKVVSVYPYTCRKPIAIMAWQIGKSSVSATVQRLGNRTRS